jgi:hypothetical protein
MKRRHEWAPGARRESPTPVCDVCASPATQCVGSLIIRPVGGLATSTEGPLRKPAIFTVASEFERVPSVVRRLTPYIHVHRRIAVARLLERCTD